MNRQRKFPQESSILGSAFSALERMDTSRRWLLVGALLYVAKLVPLFVLVLGGFVAPSAGPIKPTWFFDPFFLVWGAVAYWTHGMELMVFDLFGNEIIYSFVGFFVVPLLVTAAQLSLLWLVFDWGARLWRRFYSRVR